MPSAAEERLQALQDVERIAKAFWETGRTVANENGLDASIPWDQCHDAFRNATRATITRLLQDDVIRVGRRPLFGTRPIRGQMDIDGNEASDAEAG